MESAATRVQWGAPPEPLQKSLIDLELVRVPEKGRLVGIVLTSALEGVITHWQGGKTQPCLGEDCECKRKKLEARYNAYIAVMMPRSGVQLIVQVSRNAANCLKREIETHGKLRGMEVTLTRIGKGLNGKLTAVLCPLKVKGMTLPDEPDVKAEMYRVWGITADEIPSVMTKGPATIHIEGKRASHGKQRRGLAKVSDIIANGRLDRSGEVS